MTSSRAWLLQQMGITQYHLRRPHLLQGEIATKLILPGTKLIIVSNVFFGLNEPLVGDVLRVLSVQLAQVITLMPDQLPMLPKSLNCTGWLIGVNDHPHPFKGVILYSSSFGELLSNARAKRMLWQQMCKYDSDLFPQS
ncbi:DNA polymerase III subunit psi [Pantoea sp. Nvir]|uniref:DNA polymerase III subunit psi n=1 Tax=Pantoea sp. Nvir TaxID=2576760 RepID=UPI0013579338|nr:DNA polymerase III subunit psi [Pantoea sp. Nvir]MXP66809.1 DNA polymerase III subunit psi [Pantoea sp. Nvir]